jgi:hypothetical protein
MKRVWTRLGSERGWAMVTVMALMAILMTSTVGLAAFIDTESKQSGTFRTRETAFNLGEAALNVQVYQLARQWPGWGAVLNPGQKFPVCNETSTDSRCPSPAAIKGLFPNIDADPNATWETQIRDDIVGYESFYSEALTTQAEACDCNNNHRVWVRARATARGKTRTMVALVRADQQQEDIIRAALRAGAFDMANSGNKVLIDAGRSGSVQVRCTPVNGETVPCAGHPLGSGSLRTEADLLDALGQQVQPGNVTWSDPRPSLTPDAVERLKMTAQANGTYYTSCPASLAGEVVYLETGVVCPGLSGGTINSQTRPGMLILSSGTLVLGGTAQFYGVIVHLNRQNSSGTLVELSGNPCIRGGVMVEGNGMLKVGSSGSGCGSGRGNIVFDPDMFFSVKSIANAGVVQDSWRELTAG